MNRPQPRELVIEHSGRLIRITATSADARGWIEREAPSFGHFAPWISGLALLYVSAAYEPAEVAAWLDTYNGGRG